MSRLFLAVICLLPIGAYARDSFTKAFDEYKNGDLKTAVALFTECIQHKNNVTQSYMYRGAANVFLGEFTVAKNDLDSAFMLDSMSTRIWYYYGKLYLVQGQYPKALECYDRAISRDSLYAFAYGDRGNTKFLSGNFDDAIADISKAISIEPTEASFYSDRGYVKLKQKKYDDALADFNASLNIKPTQKAFANKGFVYALMDLPSEAIENYTSSLKMVPNDAEILYFRGLAYKAINMPDKACEDLQKSSSLGFTVAQQQLQEFKCK